MPKKAIIKLVPEILHPIIDFLSSLRSLLSSSARLPSAISSLSSNIFGSASILEFKLSNFSSILFHIVQILFSQYIQTFYPPLHK